LCFLGRPQRDGILWYFLVTQPFTWVCLKNNNWIQKQWILIIFFNLKKSQISTFIKKYSYFQYTMCPDDTATAGSWADVLLVNWDLDLLRYWWDKLVYNKAFTVRWKESKKTLFSRVRTEKITSGEGHEWFLESPQVKIMFLLSWNKRSYIITVHR
jgi:hypothetical protein